MKVIERPTEKMRMPMFSAEVGDDVLGDDPTVKSWKDYPRRSWEKRMHFSSLLVQWQTQPL
jgi:threonine aldolase